MSESVSSKNDHAVIRPVKLRDVLKSNSCKLVSKTRPPAPESRVVDFQKMRHDFLRQEFNRFRIASYGLACIALSTFIFLIILVFRNPNTPPPSWQSIALLCFTSICAALPLLRKGSISKDGGDFEKIDPLGEINRVEADAEAARGESFKQITQQIGELSLKLTDLSTWLAYHTANSGALPSKVRQIDGSYEPTLQQIREKLPPPTNKKDFQKGRFGGSESNDTRILSATVLQSKLGQQWKIVNFKVESTDGKPIEGEYAYFFLHESIEPDVYRVRVGAGSLFVSFQIPTLGSFTVGVVLDRGKTKLELDLATSRRVSAPQNWPHL